MAWTMVRKNCRHYLYWIGAKSGSSASVINSLIGVYKVIKFIDDLAGAIYDFLKFILKSFCYMIAGMLIVGVPLYLFALAFKMFH